MGSQLFELARILFFAVVGFLIAVMWMPYFLRFLQRGGFGKQIRVSDTTPIYSKLHKKKEGIPTMGGVIIWGTTLGVALLGALLSALFDGPVLDRMNFLTRGQTLLPLGAMVASALVGLLDDLFGVARIGPEGGGFRVRYKLLLYTLVAVFGAWWFFYKLEWDLFHVPFVGDFLIGPWYIPAFIFVIVAAAFSTNETDGLDGLAGGVLLVAFASLTVIAFSQAKYELATFCAVVIGSLLAFLWYNIHPAKIFLGDTGSMGLGVTMGIIAMLTNTALVLPFIAFIMVMESGSVIIQVATKRVLGRKVFLSTPIHHHFEAVGWPESQVTMRFWIIAWVMAGIGLIIGLLG